MEIMHKATSIIEEVPYCFSRSSIKFQANTGKQWWFDSNSSKITRPVAVIKFLRFALFSINCCFKEVISVEIIYMYKKAPWP